MSGNIFHWAVCPAMRMVTWFSSCPPGSLVSGPKCGGKDWEKGQSGAKIQLTLLLKKDKWKTKMIGSGLLFRGHRSAFSQREWQKLFLCLVALLVCYAEPEDCLEQRFCHYFAGNLSSSDRWVARNAKRVWCWILSRSEYTFQWIQIIYI